MKYKFLIFFKCIAFFLSSQEVCTDLVVDPIYSLNNPNLFTKGFPNDLLFLMISQLKIFLLVITFGILVVLKLLEIMLLILQL